VRFAATVLGLAAVLASTPALADETPPAAQPSAGAKEQARLHFTAGVNLLRDPEKARYEEAYTEIKRAYELVKSPSILGNIGLCAMKLERDAEAVDAYTRYLAEVTTLDNDERAQTERDLVTLRAGVAKVTVESQPDGALIHDVRITARGESVTNIYGPIQGKTELGIRRGHHVIKARFNDGREVAWELDVTGGESHVFEQPPAPPVQSERAMRVETTRPVPSSVYIGAVATGAFGVGGLVTGILAVGAKSRFDDANTGGNTGRADDLRSSAQTLNITTDILLGMTVLGAAVTTYLYLSRPSVHASPSSNEATRTKTFPRGFIRF
jgi:hypothetical protein